jgi:amino acid adenylation domain-containing protein
MDESRYEGIAIIGMAGRFPGADSVEQFWENLLAGKETVSFFSDGELEQAGIDVAELRRRGKYVAARGIMKDAECFDAAFFGIHPKEAEVMDPQQRVFLEACWTALERAGYAPNQASGSVGVFGGATFNTFYLHAIHNRPDLIDLVGPEFVMYGNEKDYLTTRVAYKLGLKGPALNVSTACSTSLVAVSQACQSLLTYQCDMALAGGVSVRVPQTRGYYFDDGNIASADGHTRTFDAQATGTAFSNGVAVVVLKRLEDAIKDADQIYAVIKGAALNNDGSQRVSFGAPGVEGQSEVIAMAHAIAGIDPETITYIEAHGTATPLGDPIEVAGLTKAFRMATDAKQFCAIGSLKSNVGHLDAAAGVSGLIKTALSLKNKVLPASLHFTAPNPKLELENSPFYVNAKLQEWRTKEGVPRRAGVSSFGTGGTNAHIVLEEPPLVQPSGPSRPWKLLTFSAKTRDALDRVSQNYVDYLKQLSVKEDKERSDRELADAAFTLQTGRSEFVHRRVLACQDGADGAVALETQDAKRVFTHHQQLKEPPVIFMFPGQGAQYVGMGAELYRTESVFRAEVDSCAAILEPILKTDLSKLIFAEEDTNSDAEALLMQTRFTQPAIFTVEYALAKLWMSWGVRPAAMIGHSVGEYVAGTLAGVFKLADALTLVARRGALVQAQPSGSMLSIRSPESEVVPLLKDGVAIAAINSPNLCVASGPHEAIAELQRELEQKGVMVRLLKTSHAFHSPMMDPVLEPFLELLGDVKLSEPKIPYVSNVTARWITAAEATAPRYWAGHVRDTVRFADGIAELMKDKRNVLLEVGPGQTLSTLARQHPAKSAEQIVLSSLPIAGEQELRGTLETLGRLWMSGLTVDWKAYYVSERRVRVVLPTYPFERKRCWPSSPVAEQISNLQPSGTIAPIASVPILQTALDQQLETAPPPVAPARSIVPRKDRLLDATRSLLTELSGYDLSAVDPSTGLLELGLDSLLLTQAAQLFNRKFGIPVTFRQLMEDLSSVDAIACYLDAKLPAEKPVVQASVLQPAATSAPVQAMAAAMPASSAPALEQLLLQQQQLTNQLMQLLGRQPAPTAAQATPGVTTPTTISAQPAASPVASGQKSHGPFKPIDRTLATAVSAKQTEALNALISRYTRRTAGSKRLTEQNRRVLADPRSVSGYKQLWKEMVYPIVTTRSDGSRVWDVDRNEYIDFVMGFGASMFGHRPPFVVKAVHEQLEHGFEIGPIQPLAGEVAALISEFTGMQRVAFTNTGSEAVLAATRVARTVTGRDKIAVFAGSYHGIFDEVLFRPVTVNGETRTAPIAPGIPNTSLGQVIVLDYGNPESLNILKARGSEIAAVLVEPVQSRRLDLQPKEFMHELRDVTTQSGSALIFDEVVTGFRLHPGGAQAYFGVRADLATYGKVIGGGLPIGVVTGDAKYMDALDGGQWQFGDSSFPEIGVTFFAGTFVRHPLVLAAAKSVLEHLKQKGPELQSGLADRTERLANQLRAAIQEFEAPYSLTQFSSLIQLGFAAEQKFAGLLFYLLREKGIHIYENRAFVLTTAHSDKDLDQLVKVFRECLAEMRLAEFLPPASSLTQAAVPTNRVQNLIPENGSPALASTTSIDQTRSFPLTEPQKEIWLAAQMGGESALAYNESLKLEFHGDFDVELFRDSLREVVKRHPILLASISTDGQSQTIPTGLKLDVPLTDLSSRNESDRNNQLKVMIEREVSVPFDLARGPLARAVIVRLSSEHHVVIWTAHHIVCDGWSGGLIVNELANIYTALKVGKVAELETPVSFREYSISVEGSAETENALSYWKEQFVDLPAPLDLPTDRPRPFVRSAKASTLKRSIPPSVYASLKRLAGQQRTTMVVLLMAGLKTLLHRLTGQSDIVVGLGVAGQAVSGKNCLVGHCVNLLPIRTKLQEDGSFEANLAAVKRGVLDAYDHHQTTVGSILQHLKVPRNTGRPPLIEVIFNLDRDPGSSRFADLEFDCDRNPKAALHFDLFFNFVEGQKGLYIECDYNTDLFDSSTIERWLAHYETLLEGTALNPAEALDSLPLLKSAELAKLTDYFGPARTFSKDRTLHQWFEEQAEKTPGRRAVSCQGQDLTYEELNRRANQLAHHLRRIGVEANTLVGLFLDRSLDLVVGILGILKAGGAYLPIDPMYPIDRIAFMLKDAKAPVLLTNSELKLDLPDQSTKVVLVDSKDFEVESDKNLQSRSAPDDLAYVIYTSGSTGKPKGSLITHYNVVRLMQATEEWYRFNDRDVWTLFHSTAFDFSVWELWGALLYGGRVVVVPYLTSRSPEDFYRLLRSEGVTVLNQTPSAFKQLVEAEARAGVSSELSLRYIIFGGEALEMRSLKPWFERHGDQKPLLVNMYGITETTVHVTYRPLSAVDVDSGSVVGVPIPDLRVYILDRHQRPVPIGVAGEVYVGGAGVARGYLNRADLTAEKFIPDPFSGEPGALLYRSGDLARFLHSEDIEYLGRADQQVKIRGFRIELGEIEATLGRHPAVRDCLVVSQGQGDEKRLVAYFTRKQGMNADIVDFRTHLKKNLPEYMIPSGYIAVDEFPLTANGKIDRKALPRPLIEPETKTDAFAPARDPIEQTLTQLWSKLLRVSQVGVNDNFFDLGGHSLLAVRIVVEIEKQYGVRLPLATFLQAPTVAGLADVLREQHRPPSWSSLVPIRPNGSKPPLFLMHAHGGNVLEYYPLAKRLPDDQPVYALQASGLDGHIETGRTMEEMASRYLQEIRMLQAHGPYFLGGFCFGGLLALEAAEQLKASGEEVALIVMMQTMHPAFARFSPNTSSLQRWWYRTKKRIDLERENISHRGSAYLQERIRRTWDIALARTEIKLDRFNNGENSQRKRSMAYVLERLGVEHDRAFEMYQPRPYGGNVLLFRASKQMEGLMADKMLGWNELLLPSLEVCEVPGHQQNLLTEPNVSRLADELKVRLDSIQQKFILELITT